MILTSLCIVKETIDKIKIQPTEEKKIFANYVTKRGSQPRDRTQVSYIACRRFTI